MLSPSDYKVISKIIVDKSLPSLEFPYSNGRSVGIVSCPGLPPVPMKRFPFPSQSPSLPPSRFSLPTELAESRCARKSFSQKQSQALSLSPLSAKQAVTAKRLSDRVEFAFGVEKRWEFRQNAAVSSLDSDLSTPRLITL